MSGIDNPPAGASAPLEIDGRVCLVTGGGNGLGAASALGLAAAGARVVLCDRDGVGLRAVAETIAQRWGSDRVVAICADVTLESDVAGAVQLAHNTFGRIDILLNNAGTGPQIVRPDYFSEPLRCWEVPLDKWRHIMEVNAIAPFAFARAVLPGMVARGWGRIVSVSTTWETMLRPGFASYGPSKAALESMTVAMARELIGTGVTVNTLHPGGPVDTAQVPLDIGVPRELLLRPEVMVPALVWLCSDGSMDFNGQRLTAAHWRAGATQADNLKAAAEPAAWPQLVRPIVMSDRGRLT